MNGNQTPLIAHFAIGLLFGVFIAVVLIPFLKTGVYAQGAGTKSVQFVKSAIMTTPDGGPGVERWQDPETKVFCYVTPQGRSNVLWHEVGFSCVR